MILVTGGAGFIGSNIVAALCARGNDEVVVCDRLGDENKWRNLAKHPIADFVLPEQLETYLTGRQRRFEAVIHMGAISATTERDGDLIMRNNFQASLRLWEWCALTHTRFIYASSAATYGDGAYGFSDDPRPEMLARLKPMNLYGWSKHLFDRRAIQLVSRDRPRPPQWAGLKFFNVYGPNEYHKGAMISVVKRKFDEIARGEPARLYRSYRKDVEDGEQQRDFIWVDDCVDVVLWLLDNPKVQGLFNCGTGRARSYVDLVRAIYAALRRRPRIEYVAMPVELRGQYQYFTEARMQRLRDAGYRRSFTSLEDGVAAYVRDYLMKPDPYR